MGMNSNRAKLTYRLNDKAPKPHLQLVEEEEEMDTKIWPDFRLEDHRGKTGGNETGARSRREPDEDDWWREREQTARADSIPPDYGGWSSPFDEETRRLEELIRNSDYFREDDSDSRHEDVRRIEPEWEVPVVNAPRYVRHTRPPWLKIGAAVAGAALSGVLLGFFVLNLFSGNNAPSPGTAGTQLTPAPGASNAPVILPDTSAGGQSEPVANTVSISYPGASYTIMQHGLFSVPEGAQQAIQALQDKGLAGAMEPNPEGRYNVYMGLAPSRDSALPVSQQLKDEQLDIFVKPYEIPAADQVIWSGDSSVLERYLEQSDELVRSLTMLTMLHLAEAEPTAFDQATYDSVKESYTAWAQVSSQAAQNADEVSRQALQQMNNQLNAAFSSLDAYQKNPSKAMLWQVQTYVLQFVIGQKQWLDTIRA